MTQCYCQTSKIFIKSNIWASLAKRAWHFEHSLAVRDNRLFDRSSRIATRCHTKESCVEGRALINARKIPGVSDTGRKKGTRAVFPRVHPSRVRPAQFHFILLAPSPLLLLLFGYFSFEAVISSPSIHGHTTHHHPADVLEISWPPFGRSTSRRMTCASRDVTSMCHAKTHVT